MLPWQDTAPTDTAQSDPSTAYDTVWTDSLGAPPPGSSGLETVMLSQDKLYVVLAVVLIIWFGILFFLYRTDRKIDRLERRVESGISQEEDPGM